MSSALYHPEQLDADLHEAWVDRRNAHDALKAKDTPANRAAWRETRDRMDFLLDLLSEG